jgi:hypothetical protein
LLSECWLQSTVLKKKKKDTNPPHKVLLT